MSTDTYIDVHSLSFDDDKNHSEFYSHGSCFTIRIGYISCLNNSHYNIYTELLNLNFIYSNLTENVIFEIFRRYKLFTKAVSLINSTEEERLKDNFGNYGYHNFHKNSPITDIVDLNTLFHFLNKNKNKFWQIRVD